MAKINNVRAWTILSAAHAKSGPLDFPSEKSLFYFFPMKRVQDTFHFFGVEKKNIFGQTTPMDSDRKCKFQRFCPARSDYNNVAP